MEDDEYKKLSLLEQCVHKSWKARVNGYEELTEMFRQIDDRKSPEFAKYLGHVKKFATDSNAVGQEKGLEAVLAFVENYDHAGKTVGEVMPAVISKCMASPRSRTRELALRVALAYIEIEKHDVVLDELLKGMELKNPKIAAVCIAAAATAVRDFGSKVINLKPLIKRIPLLFADRDKAVRDEAKLLVVEIYRWIGDGLKPHFKNLQTIQVNELEVEFLKVAGQNASPTRYLKSQQDKQNKKALKQQGNAEANKEKMVNVALDPCELIEPVEILSKLPKDFYDKCESKKWPERKEALEALEELVKAPKLEAGDYGGLVRLLKQMVHKDNNVVVVALAAKCLTGLALGLKKKFQFYASDCVPVLLEKFKEKKHNVLTAVRDAVDSVFLTTTLENIVEDVLEALNNKNPSVKMETALFLSRSFTKITVLNKKLLKPLTKSLIKLINEPDPGVRDSVAEALGSLMKLVGEKALDPFFGELKKDALKMSKIKECFERPVVIVEALQKPAKIDIETNQVVASLLAKKPTTASQLNKKEDADRSPLLVINNMKQQRIIEESELRVPRWNFTYPKKEYAELLKDQMTQADVNETLIAKMFHSDVKNHLKAIELLTKDLQGNPLALISNLDLILKWFTLRFFNSEPTVLVKAFKYLNSVFKALKGNKYSLLENEANAFIPYLILKFGDPKDSVRNEVRTLLKEISNVYGISKLFSFYILEGLKSENTRQQVECLEFMGNLIILFGIDICLPSPSICMRQVGKRISDGEESVRNAALLCAVQVHYIVGEEIFELIGEISDKDASLLKERIKAASKTLCESEIARFKNAKPQEDQATKSHDVDSRKNISREKEDELPHVVLPHQVDVVLTNSCIPDKELIPLLEDASAKSNLISSYQLCWQERKLIAESIKSSINQMASQNSTLAIDAMYQLQEMILSNKAAQLVAYEDLFIASITAQFKHLADYVPKEDSSILEVYKLLLTVTYDFTQHQILGRRVTTSVLKDLMCQFIVLLVNKDKLGHVYIAFVDRLCLILSTYTNVICALIQLLRDSVKMNISSKQTELVMKCLWRMIKTMPDAKFEVKYDEVLLEVHLFLQDFPVNSWNNKRREMRTPLNTVLTILDAMAKILGHNLLTRLTKIPAADCSEIEACILKVLKMNRIIVS